MGSRKRRWPEMTVNCWTWSVSWSPARSTCLNPSHPNLICTLTPYTSWMDPDRMTPPTVVTKRYLNSWPPKVMGKSHSLGRVTSNLPSGLRGVRTVRSYTLNPEGKFEVTLRPFLGSATSTSPTVAKSSSFVSPPQLEASSNLDRYMRCTAWVCRSSLGGLGWDKLIVPVTSSRSRCSSSRSHFRSAPSPWAHPAAEASIDLSTCVQCVSLHINFLCPCTHKSQCNKFACSWGG